MWTPLSPIYELNSTRTVLLRAWLWHWITHEGWYPIKKSKQSFYTKNICEKEHGIDWLNHCGDIIKTQRKYPIVYIKNFSNDTVHLGVKFVWERRELGKSD